MCTLDGNLSFCEVSLALMLTAATLAFVSFWIWITQDKWNWPMELTIITGVVVPVIALTFFF